MRHDITPGDEIRESATADADTLLAVIVTAGPLKKAVVASD